MKNLRSLFFLFLSLSIFSSCLVTEKEFTAIPPGTWRGILYIGDNTIPGAVSMGAADQDNKLPFNFEVEYVTVDSFHLHILNGPERITLTDIDFGHNRATGRDSLVVRFPEYGSYIKAYYEEDILEGNWYVPSKGSYAVPFLARAGVGDRFLKTELTTDLDVSGKWDATFGVETENDTWKAVGDFQQKGQKVTGTFLTETGDYRFLEGMVDDRFLWLSCFDGAHAFLFKSNIEGDSLSGFFKSGNHYETLWSAKRDQKATLQDPYDLTKVLDAEKLDFDYIKENGDTVSITQLIEGDKPILIQVLGTWCPNCKDETTFLRDYLKREAENIDVIGVAFERGKEVSPIYERIAKYKQKMQVDYPIVYGGPASKAYASEVFSQLSGITSFPTLIYLFPDRKIFKVHTGFYGPATDEYEAFKEGFYRNIEELRAQGI